jgi:Arc/MetJ-type ribon-helix-helix transcriptional regulator
MTLTINSGKVAGAGWDPPLWHLRHWETKQGDVMSIRINISAAHAVRLRALVEAGDFTSTDEFVWKAVYELFFIQRRHGKIHLETARGDVTSITVRGAGHAMEVDLQARVEAGDFPSIEAVVEHAVRRYFLERPDFDAIMASMRAHIDACHRREGIARDSEDGMKRSDRTRNSK